MTSSLLVPVVDSPVHLMAMSAADKAPKDL